VCGPCILKKIDKYSYLYDWEFESAMLNNNIEIVLLLLESGFTLGNDNVIFVACKNAIKQNNLEILKSIFDKYEYKILDNDYYQIIFYLLKSSLMDKTHILSFLLKTGKEKIFNNLETIHIITVFGTYNDFKILLEHNICKDTPILNKILSNMDFIEYDTLKLALEYGFCVNIPYEFHGINHNVVPLEYCIKGLIKRSDFMEIIDLLINNGAHATPDIIELAPNEEVKQYLIDREFNVKFAGKL